MDFKETYKKYLSGEATDEEKQFVEREIEKARAVNAEILSASNIEIKTPEEKIKAKKKKSLKQTVKTIFISVIVFFVISTVIFGAVGIVAGKVLLADACLAAQLLADGALGVDEVAVLHVVGLFVGHAIEVDDLVLDLECLSRQTYATLHIVLTAVHRAPVDLAEYVGA